MATVGWVAAASSAEGTNPDRAEVARLDWQRTPILNRAVLVLTALAEVDAVSAGELRAWARRGLAEIDDVRNVGLHCPALLVDLRGVARLGADGLTALIDAVRDHPTLGHLGAAGPSAGGAGGRHEPLRVLVDSERPALRPTEIRGLAPLLGIYLDPDTACGMAIAEQDD